VTSNVIDSWTGAFDAPASSSIHVEFHIVRRGGVPLLYLPSETRCAANALALYPAQSTRARFAKTILAAALRMGLRPGLERFQFRPSPNDSFAAFLRKAAGTTALPRFAVLAGNPNAPARRFVFLVFGPDGSPRAVVKTGINDSARALLAQEEAVLQSIAERLPSSPKIHGRFESPSARAIALEFIPGESPKRDASVLQRLLSSWLITDRRVLITELPAYQRLLPLIKDSPAADALVNARFHPALVHGDFAPWNIKAAGDHWTVLDWERGELEGVPAWDWFHFELQHALLVGHESDTALFTRCKQLLNSEHFVAYAKAAEITHHVRPLMLAYLANCLRVTNQTEGRAQLLSLERRLSTEWFSGKAHPDVASG
jgi:hypothetical protein